LMPKAVIFPPQPTETRYGPPRDSGRLALPGGATQLRVRSGLREMPDKMGRSEPGSQDADSVAGRSAVSRKSADTGTSYFVAGSLISGICCRVGGALPAKP